MSVFDEEWKELKRKEAEGIRLERAGKTLVERNIPKETQMRLENW